MYSKKYLVQSFVSFNNIFQQLTKLTEIQINTYTNSIPRLQFIKCNGMALIFISYNKRKIWLSWNIFFLIWIPSIKYYFSICIQWKSGVHFDTRNINYTIYLYVSETEDKLKHLNDYYYPYSWFYKRFFRVICIVFMFGTLLFTYNCV